ncbi:MAG: LysM peptidoglycan-binding domain-containing protein [Ferruginibacter sp.]|nr:LysM peptidoglycan-binding domain-containing protein [Cytophagales bacterium]
MKRGIIPVLSLVFFLSFPLVRAGTPGDSVGVERKGAKTLILHRVEAGQTLFAISRRYRVPVDEIRAENAGVEADLQPGQVVKVPWTPPSEGRRSPPGTHRVATGESLFGIARQYQVSVADLRQWNGLSDNTINVGDELAISAGLVKNAPVADTPVAGTPVAAQAGEAQNAADSLPVVTANRKTHTVAPGQTLNAVARLYQLSLDDLRQWNHLVTDALTVGQELVVQNGATGTGTVSRAVEPATAVPTPVAASPAKKAAEPTPVVALPTRETEPRKGTVEKPAVNQAEDNPTESVPNRSPAIPVPNANVYQRKVEMGLAELIEGTQTNEKYLALHRTAPVGTIIQVKNLMNELSVFAKVIGRLPNTGANEKIVIRISGKAYERLAAVDKKFRVEISYVP